MISSANWAGLLAIGWRCRRSQCGRRGRQAPSSVRPSRRPWEQRVGVGVGEAWGARRARQARSGSASTATQHSARQRRRKGSLGAAGRERGRSSLSQPAAAGAGAAAVRASRPRATFSASSFPIHRLTSHGVRLLPCEQVPDSARDPHRGHADRPCTHSCLVCTCSARVPATAPRARLITPATRRRQRATTGCAPDRRRGSLASTCLRTAPIFILTAPSSLTCRSERRARQ